MSKYTTLENFLHIQSIKNDLKSQICKEAAKEFIGTLVRTEYNKENIESIKSFLKDYNLL